MIFFDILKYAAFAALFLILLVITTLAFWGWHRGVLVYAINDNNEVVYGDRSGRKNSAVQALALAKPYLQETLEQNRKNRGGSHYSWVRTYVVSKKGWYYIVKDDYPWVLPVFEVPGKYENIAIRVNIHTGEIIRPTRTR